MSHESVSEEAHSAVAIGIAEKFMTQPRDMTWEDRCDELATAAIEAMQIFILMQRDDARAIEARRATTVQQGVVHESASANGGLPKE